MWYWYKTDIQINGAEQRQEIDSHTYKQPISAKCQGNSTNGAGIIHGCGRQTLYTHFMILYFKGKARIDTNNNL